MRLLFFMIGLIVLGIMLPLFKEFSGQFETILTGITGIEDWMALIPKLLPILIPLSVVIMGILYITKGSRNKSQGG
jgi:hypothetical protein